MQVQSLQSSPSPRQSKCILGVLNSHTWILKLLVLPFVITMVPSEGRVGSGILFWQVNSLLISHFKNELLLNYFRLQSLLDLHETLFYMMMLFDTSLTDHVMEHKPSLHHHLYQNCCRNGSCGGNNGQPASLGFEWLYLTNCWCNK